MYISLFPGHTVTRMTLIRCKYLKIFFFVLMCDHARVFVAFSFLPFSFPILFEDMAYVSESELRGTTKDTHAHKRQTYHHFLLGVGQSIRLFDYSFFPFKYKVFQKP